MSNGQVVNIPVYVLIEEDSIIIPGTECKFVKPSELPEDGSYFIVNRKGFQVSKNSKILKGIAPADSIGFLANEYNRNPQMNIPKIPGVQLMRALNFFRKVFKEYKAEAELMIVYNRNTQEYDYFCPTQNVSGGHVHYDVTGEGSLLPRHCSFIGTIHSHCDFNAYHSGVDTDDEKHQDGLHITLGHVNQEEFSFSAAIAINGKRWNVKAEDAITNMTCKSDFDEDDDEDDLVTQYYTNSKGQKVPFTYKSYKRKTGRTYCSVELTKEEQDMLDVYQDQIEGEWFDRVEQRNLYYKNAYSWQKPKNFYKKDSDDSATFDFDDDDYRDKDMPDEGMLSRFFSKKKKDKK